MERAAAAEDGSIWLDEASDAANNCEASPLERRVLWCRGSEAALLYRMRPGAAVSCRAMGMAMTKNA